MEPTEILKKPYARQVVPQPDGLFKAEILEFSGCFAVGDTAAAALASLEDVAIDWIAATLVQGQNVPEPTESAAYSGKYVQRFSKTLHKKATQFALREGVSLNQFVANCVAERVGMLARPLTVYALPLQASANLNLQVVAGGTALSLMDFSGGRLMQHSNTSTGPRLLGVPVSHSAG